MLGPEVEPLAESARPKPWADEPPEGYRFEPRVDPDWRLAKAGFCRRPKCRAPAVAALNRGRINYRAGPMTRQDSWWAYCADHLYGRWIEDGRIMGWVLTEVKPLDGDRP